MGPFPLIGENSRIYAIFISDRGSTTLESHIFNNHIEISSWPCALLTFKFLVIVRISSFSKKKLEFNLEWILKDIVDGKTLTIG